jgi:PilZ domain
VIKVNEQRRNQRFELKLPFEIIRGGTNTKTMGETKNVSSSGVLFTSETAVEVGEPIEYLITFPKPAGSRSEVRLRCVGTVLREDEQSKFAATLERYEFVRER